MTFEEMQRTMEFMLQHGAHLDARLEKLAESLQSLRESHEQLRESQAPLTGAFLRMTELMEESQRRFDERFRVLTDAQKGTDERLNALINMFERHITGPDHGHEMPQ